MPGPSREIQTIMHPTKMRMLQVKTVQQLTPHMVRVTLTGDLSDFVSASADDHVKVFFPHPGQEKPTVPAMTANGPVAPEGQPSPIMRDYTPRRFDTEKNELDLEFHLHKNGVGANWAANAEPGQFLGVAGPRGSRVVPYNFDWYLMIGDETSIPSISRRMKEIPADVSAIAVIEIENESEQIKMDLNEKSQVIWVHRKGKPSGDPQLLKEAVLKLAIPSGEYFAWIAAEGHCSKELKELLITVKGAQEEWIKATAYWRIKES